MPDIIKQIRAELRAAVTPQGASGYTRFFKEPVKFYGITGPAVRKIAVKFWPSIKNLAKSEIFKLCEELLKTDYSEEAFIVAEWLPKITSQFGYSDLAIFERWIDSYINNWAKCDGFCNHTIGNFVDKFPASLTVLKQWAHSPNRWMKRAAAVSLVLPARHGKFLSEIFEIADILLLDKDDMVQKGYGWMLKEASKPYRQEVFDYVVKHKAVMPRTALRYSIELMPPDMRTEAMHRQ